MKKRLLLFLMLGWSVSFPLLANYDDSSEEKHHGGGMGEQAAIGLFTALVQQAIQKNEEEKEPPPPPVVTVAEVPIDEKVEGKCEAEVDVKKDNDVITMNIPLWIPPAEEKKQEDICCETCTHTDYQFYTPIAPETACMPGDLQRNDLVFGKRPCVNELDENGNPVPFTRNPNCPGHVTDGKTTTNGGTTTTDGGTTTKDGGTTTTDGGTTTKDGGTTTTDGGTTTKDGGTTTTDGGTTTKDGGTTTTDGGTTTKDGGTTTTDGGTTHKTPPPPPPPPPPKCHCECKLGEEWNPNGPLMVQLVSPAGAYAEVPIGGQLPLATNGADTDLFKYTCFRNETGGPQCQDTCRSTLEAPLPMTVQYFWRIRQGYGALVEKPVYPLPMQASVQGPAAIYMAPETMPDDREVLIRLLVEDSPFHLENIPDPPAEIEIRILLVEKDRAPDYKIAAGPAPQGGGPLKQLPNQCPCDPDLKWELGGPITPFDNRDDEITICTNSLLVLQSGATDMDEQLTQCADEKCPTRLFKRRQDDAILYNWSATDGEIIGTSEKIVFQPPSEPKQVTIFRKAKDSGYQAVDDPIDYPPLRVNVVRLDLDVDTNRDGRVADDDEDKEDDWTKDRGAIFNVNYDRDGNRQSPDGTPLPDALHFTDTGEPAQEDFVIENEADKQDIAPLVVRALGVIPQGAQVILKVDEKEDIESIHLYPQIAAGQRSIWGSIGDRVPGRKSEPLEMDITPYVSATQDTTFGIEGLFFRSVGSAYNTINPFDGEIDFTIELRDKGEVRCKDKVRLKVAPWMMISHRDRSFEAWAIEDVPVNDPFVKTAKADAGYYGLDDSAVLQTFSDYGVAGSQWFQDHLETGWTQRPGGPKTHSVFRLPYGRQPLWPLKKLLARDVGTFQLGGDLSGEAGDFGGNLEIMPPTPSYPLGQIVMGSTSSGSLFSFMESQQVQPPFEVPTDWLAVSHVDEVFGFTGRGHEIVIADPSTAYQLLSAMPKSQQEENLFFSSGLRPQTGVVTKNAAAPNRIITGLNLTGQGWHYIRIYDSSASGSGAEGQVAFIHALGNGMIEVERVWDTGSKVMGSSALGPSAYWNMQGSVPESTGWFRPPRKGDKFILAEGSKFWWDGHRHGWPALITVKEVLADADLKAFNLGPVQSKIDEIARILQNRSEQRARFLKTPVIFYGEAANFAHGRKTVAYTPGLANFQLVGQKYYFPRQFGPKDQNNRDIFEARVSAQVPNVHFVDDWNLYHRLEGEVHCGSNTKREFPQEKWWENQPS